MDAWEFTDERLETIRGIVRKGDAGACYLLMCEELLDEVDRLRLLLKLQIELLK